MDAVLAGLFIVSFLLFGHLSTPTSLPSIRVSQVIESNPTPPIEENPTPPIEQDPTPPIDENPAPPTEQQSMQQSDSLGA